MELNHIHRQSFLDQLAELQDHREVLNNCINRATKESPSNENISRAVWDAQLYINGVAIEACKQAIINNNIDY